MNKEDEIELLKYKILKLVNELPLLCDEDYYNACDLIEYYKAQLNKLKSGEKE